MIVFDNCWQKVNKNHVRCVCFAKNRLHFAKSQKLAVLCALRLRREPAKTASNRLIFYTPFVSFRKIERTAQGTVLVSSFMRNLPLVTQRRLRITVFTTLLIQHRVFRLVSAMTEKNSQGGNQGMLTSCRELKVRFQR